MGLGLRVCRSPWVWAWLVVGLVLVGSWGVAQELSLWSSAPSAGGLVEVWTDGPALDLVVSDPIGALFGSTLQYEVRVDGARLADAEARALLVSLLDTLQLMHLRDQPAGLGRSVMEHTPYTRLRGERGQWMAHYPFTVASADGAETNQSHALLAEALGKAPGLDNERVRRALWRDVILDLALLGSLREAFGSGTIDWLQVGDDPATATNTQAARAFAILQQGSGISSLGVAVPGRLSDVVTLAQRVGVPQEVLQRALDASMVEGLYAGAYHGAAGVRQGSPFSELLDRAEAFGLALDVVSLVTQVGGDVFDGVAMQLSANAAADARLSFLEDLVADDCVVGHALVDVALCGGLALAREEFDVLSEAVLTGMVHAIAQALHDGDSLLTYAGLTASIVGHVASLHGAGAITTSASVAGAGVLVLKSLASIASEFQLVRRAFLLAHLNQVLFVRLGDVGDSDLAEVSDVSVWARSREHTALALLIEWGFFHTLHEGYTASALTPAGLLHWLTQWIHGSGDVIPYLNARHVTALQQLTNHQPITSLATLRPDDRLVGREWSDELSARAGSAPLAAALSAFPDFRRMPGLEWYGNSSVNFIHHSAIRAGGESLAWYSTQLLASVPAPEEPVDVADVEAAVGFDMGSIDLSIAAGRQLRLLFGGFDDDRVGAVLSERGYTPGNVEHGSLWCGPGGCHGGHRGRTLTAEEWKEPAAALYGGDSGLRQPVAWDAGWMATGADHDVVLAAVSGRTASAPVLSDQPELLALLAGLDGDWVIRQGWVNHQGSGPPLDLGSPPRKRYAEAYVDGFTAEEEIALAVLVFREEDVAVELAASAPQSISDRILPHLGVTFGEVLAERTGRVSASLVPAEDGFFVVRIVLSHPHDPEEAGSADVNARLFTIVAYTFLVYGVEWMFER